MRKIVIVVVGVVVLLACSSEVGPMFTDAGQALVDVGEALDGNVAAQDGGAGGARVVEVQCDGLGTRTVTAASGAVTSQTTYYATLDDLSVMTLHPDVSAVVCAQQIVTSDPLTCPAGAHCTDTHPMPLACVGALVELDNGHARVACGSSVRSDSDGAGPAVATESGVRYMFARFVLR